MQHYAAIWSCPKSHSFRTCCASFCQICRCGQVALRGEGSPGASSHSCRFLLVTDVLALLLEDFTVACLHNHEVLILPHLLYFFFPWPNFSSNVLEIGAGSRQAWRTPAPRPFKVHLKGLCVAKGLWWESRNEWKLRTKHCVNLWASNNQSCDWSNEKYPWKGRMIQLDSIAIFLSAFAC
jgi:hypothetical protein